MVTIAAVGSLLAEIVVPASLQSQLQIMLYSASYLVAFLNVDFLPCVVLFISSVLANPFLAAFDEITQFLVISQLLMVSSKEVKNNIDLIYACSFVLSFNACAQFYVFCLFFFDSIRNFVYLVDCAFK